MNCNNDLEGLVLHSKVVNPIIELFRKKSLWLRMRIIN